MYIIILTAKQYRNSSVRYSIKLAQDSKELFLLILKKKNDNPVQNVLRQIELYQHHDTCGLCLNKHCAIVFPEGLFSKRLFSCLTITYDIY